MTAMMLAKMQTATKSLEYMRLSSFNVRMIGDYLTFYNTAPTSCPTLAADCIIAKQVELLGS